MKTPTSNKRKEILVEAIKSTASLYCKSGRVNEYRRSFLMGTGATPHESTFDKRLGTRGGHKCCGSKVWWRHKVTCKNAVRNAPDDLSDLKSIVLHP